MVGEERSCRATKADGTPCASPARLVDPSSGFCPSHDPAKREMLMEAASMGGKAATRNRKAKGLDPDDLPPLDSYEAAETWTHVIGRAAALGTISSSAANAALRAVKEWREARDGGRISERLEALEKAMLRWRETGDPTPVVDLLKEWGRKGLRVVDGGRES